MKRTWKILMLCLTVLTLLCLLIGCGEPAGEDPGTTEPGPTEPGSDDPVNPEPDGPTQMVSTSEIDFLPGEFTWNTDGDGMDVLSISYDGEPHMLTSSNHEGKPNPERAAVTYEYYLNGTKIAVYDENLVQTYGDAKYANGMIEAGTYEVRLVYKMSGYRDGVKTAKFVITSSYAINYVVATPVGAGVPAMKPNVQNPTYFATNDYEVMLYSPSMESDTLGYNFRGWFLDEACTERITEINGDEIPENLLTSGSLTLYAKFEACVAYPKFFVNATTQNRVETEPAELPAIPGYDAIAPDAFKLIDLSVLSENGNGLGYGYQTHGTSDGIYGINKAPSIQTAGGEYALQWQDPSDIWDGPIIGGKEGDCHTPGDKLFGAMLSFASPAKNFNYAKYDTIEFWMYNANINADKDGNPTPNVITMLVFTDYYDGISMYIDLTLDFTGWKKFTLHLSDFGAASGGLNMNINKINFYGVNFSGGTHSDKATLGYDTNPNFVYFSDFFLTNNQTNYGSSKANGFIPNPVELPKVLNNLVNMPVNATLSDDDIASVLELLSDNSQADTGSFWLDYPLTDSYNICESYKRLAQLSEAWNDTESTYYHSAELLNVIADGLNYSADGAGSLVNMNAPVDQYFEDAAYYLTKAAVNISAYTNSKHNATWMVPVFHFVQGPTGSGDRLIKTAYTYACASALTGDSRSFMTGVRSIFATLGNNRITMAMNPANVVDGLALIAAMKDTAFMIGNRNNYIPALFDWFYYSIDSFLVDGTPISEVAALPDYVSLADYIRGMLMVYDLANGDVQNKFAAAVKYYMAQDENLEAAIKANEYYRMEATALEALKANATAAANPTTDATIIRTYENIGQVFYRTADGYILIDRVGTVIGTSIDALNCNNFYTFVIGDVLTIATADRAVFITGNTAQVTYYGNESPNATFTSGNTNVIVTAADSIIIPGATVTGAVMETAGAPVIAGTTVVDGKLLMKLYNYTEATAKISVVLNGQYTASVSGNLYEVKSEGSNTGVTLNLELLVTPVPGTDGKTTTKRQFTDSVFELTLTPKA